MNRMRVEGDGAGWVALRWRGWVMNPHIRALCRPASHTAGRRVRGKQPAGAWQASPTHQHSDVRHASASRSFAPTTGREDEGAEDAGAWPFFQGAL